MASTHVGSSKDTQQQRYVNQNNATFKGKGSLKAFFSGGKLFMLENIVSFGHCMMNYNISTSY